MFKKILVVEDISSYNYAVKKLMEELKITKVDQVYYCDDAILKIRKSYFEDNPYELLITDLSFINDREFVTLATGEELIKEVKKEFPKIKIIVFSIEFRPHIIASFFEKYKIDAFITKGRKDIEELKKAIEEVEKNKIHIYNNIAHKERVVDLTTNDFEFIKLLASGMSILQTSEELKKKKIYPNSISYLNKRIMLIRQQVGAKNTLHLLKLFTDWGLL